MSTAPPTMTAWLPGILEVLRPSRSMVYGVNVLLTHKLLRGTRKYFVPVLAPGAVSAKSEIMFVKLFCELCAAPRHEVPTASFFLARYPRRTLGRNEALVEEASGQDV